MTVRAKLGLGWVLFLAVSGLAGFFVHRLYQRTRTEIAAQAERAVQQTKVLTAERIQLVLHFAQLSIMRELAGFHDDGLAQTLQRWDAANEIVTSTFLWSEPRGLTRFNAAESGALRDPELAGLWSEFREWRAAHPDASSRELSTRGDFAVLAFRTLDAPSFPATSVRYQAENLELMAAEGKGVDPWVGWAVAPHRADRWIFWYQPGPKAPVRGCLVDPASLLARLQDEVPQNDLVTVSFVPVAGTSSWSMKVAFSSASASRASVAFPALPSHQLVVEPGPVFQQKMADARFDALIAALLLAIFLLGAVALGLYTRRAARDAGRKITFVTQVSHELRTPLTSIRMFADLLGAPELPEEKRRKFAGTIAAESARLGGLIERLLAFNALEKGTHRLTLESFEVSGLMREVAEETAAKLAEAGLRPELQLPAGTVLARGDRSIVKQALLNLLDNACKYAAEGGWVGIAVTPASDRIAIAVSDRGAGIPAAIRDRLFEPFVQGSQTMTAKSPGIGLGLSLSRGLLRQAGADLVTVPTASGATFEIRLPLASTP